MNESFFVNEAYETALAAFNEIKKSVTLTVIILRKSNDKFSFELHENIDFKFDDDDLSHEIFLKVSNSKNIFFPFQNKFSIRYLENNFDDNTIIGEDKELLEIVQVFFATSSEKAIRLVKFLLKTHPMEKSIEDLKNNNELLRKELNVSEAKRKFLEDLQENKQKVLKDCEDFNDTLHELDEESKSLINIDDLTANDLFDLANSSNKKVKEQNLEFEEEQLKIQQDMINEKIIKAAKQGIYQKVVSVAHLYQDQILKLVSFYKSKGFNVVLTKDLNTNKSFLVFDWNKKEQRIEEKENVGTEIREFD